MKAAERIAKLEASRSPKQLIRHWLQRLAQFKSKNDYLTWVARDWKTRSTFGLTPAEFRAWLAAHRGGKTRSANKRTFNAREELVFLHSLFWGVIELGDQAREQLTICLGITIEFERLKSRLLASARLFEYLPYPLEFQLAAAVEAAIGNYVEPFDPFLEKISHWRDRAFHQGGLSGSVTVENDSKEKRAAVALAKSIRDSLASGKMWGALVELSPFPIPSLALISLVDREWIDRKMLELAESAALLEERGLRFASSDDPHILAPQTVCIGETMEPAPENRVSEARAEAEARLLKFPGKVQEIGGRTYLNINDYREWSGRKVAGALPAIPGVDARSWNAWLCERSVQGQAELAGVALDRLVPVIKPSDFVSCDGFDDAGVRRRARSMVLHQIGGTLGTSTAELEKQVLALKGEISRLLAGQVYIRAATEKISTAFFEGHSLFFKQEAEQLDAIMLAAESLAAEYNYFASFFQKMRALDEPKRRRRSFKMNLEAVKTEAAEVSKKLVDSKVAIAKAWTMAFFGERAAGARLLRERRDALDAYLQKMRKPARARSQPTGAQDLDFPESGFLFDFGFAKDSRPRSPNR
jgi:hypothetical protein